MSPRFLMCQMNMCYIYAGGHCLCLLRRTDACIYKRCFAVIPLKNNVFVRSYFSKHCYIANVLKFLLYVKDKVVLKIS